MAETLDFQIIANLMAGKGGGRKVLDRLTRFLDEHGLTYDVLAIDHPTPISLLPDNGRVITQGVICLGGDGTVAETIGYILNRKKNLPLAIVPIGTANFIARSYYLEDHFSNLDFLLKKKIKKVNIGLALYGEKKNYFMLGFGLGFEEKFLKITKEKLKSKLGIFSYILAAMAELLSLKKIPISIKGDNIEKSLNVCTLMVLKTYPQILKIFPLFKDKTIFVDNGLLSLKYVEYKNYFQAWLGTLALHVLGEQNFGLVQTISGPEFAFDSSILVGTQVDGELKGNLPVKICVLPRSFEFWI